MKRPLLAALVLFACSCQKNTAIPTNSLGPRAYKLTSQLLEFGPRPPSSEGHQKARAFLTKHLQAAGWDVREDPFTASTILGEKHFTNVRARFGKNAWNTTPTALLGAHLDSKLMPPQENFLGADDSASACAAIVAMAEFLAKNDPARAAQIELVLFDGEEAFADDMTTLDGLFGSRYYANEYWRDQPQKPKFGVIFDMIGHKNLRIKFPSDSPPHLLAQFRASAEKQNAAAHFSVSNFPILDDHEPLNRAGIPTIDMIGDFSQFDWWHHHAGGKDDLQIISPDSLDTSIRVALDAINALLPRS